jgi:hypothetical protein
VFPFNHNDTTPRARASWARSIDSLLADADRRQPLLRSMRSIFRPAVVRACAPSLLEIRSILVDPSAEVRPEAMRRLRDFITDGSRSPLIRGELEAARRVAEELAIAFTLNAHSGAAPASPPTTVEERVHVAV